MCYEMLGVLVFMDISKGSYSVFLILMSGSNTMLDYAMALQLAGTCIETKVKLPLSRTRDPDSSGSIRLPAGKQETDLDD